MAPKQIESQLAVGTLYLAAMPWPFDEHCGFGIFTTWTHVKSPIYIAACGEADVGNKSLSCQDGFTRRAPTFGTLNRIARKVHSMFDFLPPFYQINKFSLSK